jgi:hypothetical protein
MPSDEPFAAPWPEYRLISIQQDARDWTYRSNQQ